MSRSTSVSAQYVPLLDSDKKSPRFLLNWVYDELGIQLEDLSEMKTGTIYCQLVHKLFPQVMDLKKVIFNCTLPVEIDRNFCLLHLALAKLRTFRDAAQQECIKRLTNKFMLWFHKFYMLNKKNAEERIGRKSYPLTNAQVKRSNSIVIPSKPADQQGSHKVRVAPRSQSLVNRPEMRRRNTPAEPCMMDFVSRIPKPHLTNWQKVKTDSMGNIYQMLDGMLQSSSTFASSMPKLDVNPGPPEFDTSLNEASKDPKLILFNKLLTEKSISQKESANNDAPKQEEFSNKNHSKQESVSNSALKLEVCSNNDDSKQKCLNNNAPKYEEVSNNNGPKRESPNSNNSKQESLSNDASKQASLNNDASMQESSSNEDPRRKSPNNDAPKHQEYSKIDASKHEEF
ncbi:serum response factor homolog B-like isoform X2 [Drosophila sulfurigaster albostrigata]|uniref:serum response factor homolog B-like isoform X2 n=1 Tax=Drosophila sulfurigaster albostrigata TaxID=89887 RepID=UPI002D21E5EB|nr:serum response factor homolog B-like isoform X2 [Drosophila sulfurigaster albostrigata]